LLSISFQETRHGFAASPSLDGPGGYRGPGADGDGRLRARPEPASTQVRSRRTQAAKDCPDYLPAETRCFAGQDPNGAYYWIAIPKAWNGSLVLHTHGGPRLKAPKPDDALEDLERFSVTVKEGFAWAGSNYRRAGYGVRSAAEDSDTLRQIFWTSSAAPSARSCTASPGAATSRPRPPSCTGGIERQAGL
jgi:hypothetical protein